MTNKQVTVLKTALLLLLFIVSVLFKFIILEIFTAIIILLTIFYACTSKYGTLQRFLNKRIFSKRE